MSAGAGGLEGSGSPRGSTPRPARLGLGRDEQRTADRARAVTAFGLDGYAEVAVHALSTGTRPVCELACLALVQPRVMLLYEPSAGLAQPEVERPGGRQASGWRQL